VRRTALVPLLASLALACAGETTAPVDRAFDRFVLVTIDTLRADQLGVYGYRRATSPFFDSLAAQSVLFERAYAPMSATAPSHATIFTSLYPAQHGVRRNGLVLGDDFVTLAELLSAAGFQTAGFTATITLFTSGGLRQGFQEFDTAAKVEGVAYRGASETIDSALRWLDGSADLDDPLFLFVHLFDPHGPLVPPKPYREAFELRSTAQRERFARYLTGQRHVVPGAFQSGLQGMLWQYMNYDAEIRYADTELARLFEALGARGDTTPTLWVITADHGQGMGSHSVFGHAAHIYEEQVRVPLLFHATNAAFSPRRIPAIVEHVDLLPTLAELAGLREEPKAADGRRRGRSLVPLLRGEETSGFRGHGAFAQRRAFEPQDPSRPNPSFELGEKYAWVEERWKLIHRTIGRDQLYDLQTDPYETRNLAAEQPEQAAALKARLLARIEELRGEGTPEAPKVDEEAQRQLEALGYLP
jgi:arylsulfatase A-like enzyme